MSSKPKFHGESVKWFVGVVEENNDETSKDKLMIGRCRVRILGVHSPTKVMDDETGEGIPVDKLIWGTPIMPPIYSSMGGIGVSPANRIMQGSWVLCMSMDGNKMQEVYIMGTIKGRPIERLNPNNQGFCDPDNVYPTDDMLHNPDTHALAMGGGGGFIVEHKNGNRNEDIRMGSYNGGGGSWSQPISPYAAKYPFNLVYGSESGHVKEVDDSKGAQRLHWYHNSGTFIEIDAEGTKVCKTVGDDYEITVKDRNVLIKGDLNVTVEGNCTFFVKGNMVSQVSGNSQSLVEGNSETHVVGDADLYVDGDATTIVKGDSDLLANGDIDIIARGNTEIKARSVDVKASSSIDLAAPNVNIKASSMSLRGGDIKISAGDVGINGHVKINGTTQIGY